MRKLFTASDLIEAQLLKRLLMAEGIKVQIKNEDLQSGLGELPFVEMWPEIWVLESGDWLRARALLSEFRSPSPGDDWTCPACHETNPGSFEVCWSCAAPEFCDTLKSIEPL